MTGDPPSPGLRDQQGCLTEAGFSALERAPVGRGPADLVAHVAACDRCQRRMLSGGTETGLPATRGGFAGGAQRQRQEAPPVWRGVAMALVVLLMALVALMAVRFWAPS